MNDVITIFQDYKQNIIQYKEHFPVIEEFKSVFGEQNLILQTDGSIQIRNYVGFFQKGKTKVQVLPKIYSDSEVPSNEVEESMSFLFRLLAWSEYFTFKEIDDLDIGTSNKDILEIFIRIFIKRFLKEFNRAPHYEYVSIVENQQIIKGKILFTETIKRNTLTNHQHIVEFDEFSVDNKLNQLFKSIIQELIVSTNDSTNKMLLKQGITLLEDVSFINKSSELFNSIQFNRQNERYHSLFNFAKLFFYNNQPNLSSGKERTFSFLVPLNLLFENSVKVFLRDIETLLPTVKLKYHNHKYFGIEKNENRFRLEPDFIISKKETNETIAVLDAKFTDPFANSIPRVKDSILYQLNTYASAYHCNLLFVIYPTFKNAPTKETFLTRYTLNTPYNKTELVLLQVDITDDSRERIQQKLNSCIKNELLKISLG